MFRRSSAVLLVAAALLGLGRAAAPARGDEVAEYLERHGLFHLLAAHWRRELAATRGPERGELVLRLADLYAELLETTSDPSRRELVEMHGRELLEDAPPDGVDALRLALLRGAYRSAERVAERHRLRLADEAELEQAAATLEEVVPELQRLQLAIGTGLGRQRQRLARTHDRDAMDIQAELEELEQLEKQCRFITAWALYYHAWLADRPEEVRLAQRLFGELIDPQNPQLQPREVSIDLRSAEAIARSILGMALCQSLAERTANALQWVVLLEHAVTAAAVREQVPAWKMAIYFEGREYLPVLDLLDALEAQAEEMPVAWLRLAAVGGLEVRTENRYAVEIVQRAVTQLAARGELEQVLDLARRYGVDALGHSGFALRYVAGALAYHEAREAHGDEAPTGVPELSERYRAAAAALGAALRESDVDRYRGAAESCRRLIGWCHYFAGDFIAARSAFLDSADRLTGPDAADALWMAIVSLDHVEGADAAVRRELEELVDRFLRDYPSHEHAARLLLKRATDAETIDPELIDELLDVPPTADVYDAARNRAAQMLYALFRRAAGSDRAEYGNRYVSVALPLRNEDEARLGEDDPIVEQRYVIRCRRLLEVALAPGIERLVAARSTLEAVEQRLGDDAWRPFADEIAYRRLQLLLRHDQLAAARRTADAMWDADEGAGAWSRLAVHAIFRSGYDRWRAAGAADDREALADVVTYGARVLREYENDAEAWSDRRVAGYATAVAEAAWVQWERSRDAETGQLALHLFRDRLLEAQPNNARFLEATGHLAEAFGDDELALRCLRRLVAGTPSDELRWFEAKYNLIRVLARVDPTRARAVLDQHVLLNPDFGPPPWGERLRRLEAELPPLETGAPVP